jgi:GNAT superfamily N-acetyltransferase
MDEPASITTRVAIDDDLEQILAIDNDPTRAGLILDAIRDSRCLVAASGGTVIGFAVAGEFFGFDFLELLVVAPDLRRRGIGAALMSAWERWATTPKLFTSTNDSNVPMQRLCQKLGFVRSGSIENLDEDDPEIFYFKPNPNPAV